MRIALIECYLKPTPDYGLLARLLRTRGHEVWLATTGADQNLVWEDGRHRHVQARMMPLPGAVRWLRRLPLFVQAEGLWFLWQLRQFLRRAGVEVVQVNPAGLRWVWLLPLLMPMCFVLDLRQIGQRDASGWFGPLKNRLTYGKRFWQASCIYDAVTFLHEAGATKVLGRDWRRWAKVVPLGVDEDFLRTIPGPQPPYEKNGHVSFLYIGTLSRIRRLERLLYAAKAMLAVTNRFRLVFVGPETAQGYYHQLVQELGLSAVVTIHPPVPYDQVPAEILRHDVALAYVPEYPLDWQYHPTLKVIEYRALGIPMIATDVAPNRECVVDGENGLLVRNEPAELAQAMLRFVNDADFLAHCHRAAQRLRRGTPWSAIAECYEQTVYLPLLAKKTKQEMDIPIN
jgi:glycosyltransferase involved in cell wall biosynthesis